MTSFIKILLLITILISLVGSIGERENDKKRHDMVMICVISIMSLTAISILL